MRQFVLLHTVLTNEPPQVLQVCRPHHLQHAAIPNSQNPPPGVIPIYRHHQSFAIHLLRPFVDSLYSLVSGHRLRLHPLRTPFLWAALVTRRPCTIRQRLGIQDCPFDKSQTSGISFALLHYPSFTRPQWRSSCDNRHPSILLDALIIIVMNPVQQLRLIPLLDRHLHEFARPSRWISECNEALGSKWNWSPRP
jgi:hypothetical protein